MTKEKELKLTIKQEFRLERCSSISVQECSELCDFIEAWAVDNDVQLAAGFYSMEVQ